MDLFKMLLLLFTNKSKGKGLDTKQDGNNKFNLF